MNTHFIYRKGQETKGWIESHELPPSYLNSQDAYKLAAMLQ